MDLADRLIKEGRDSVVVQELFQSERVGFVDELIPRNMIPLNSSAAYDGFLTDAQIRDGAQFYLTWGEQLKNLLSGTGIPAEIVVAVLKIESNLGQCRGDHPVFTTLATLAAMNNPQYWAHFADTSTTVTYEYLSKRARKRSRWAYRELNAFLDVCQRQGWNTLQVTGSWAGAFGWAQFLPSSFAYYSRDGDGDHRVDPNNLFDAVASLANYLLQARWGNSLESQRKALHRYNPSNAYVDCVLEYSNKLRSYLKAERLVTP
jgi:membrane-bound lytic murein transglycosylase B